MDKDAYVQKLNLLVEEGLGLARNRPLLHKQALYIPDDNAEQEGYCYKWYLKAEQLIVNLFGKESDWYRRFVSFKLSNSSYSFSKDDVLKQVAELGALSDLIRENGLEDVKGLGRIELSGDVLKDAREILVKGDFPLNIPAIYGRILLETSIMEFTKRNGLEASSDMKFSKIIVELKTKGIIKQSFERELQAKYDIGNDAAHMKFEEFQKKYEEMDVKEMLDFIEQKVLALIGG